MTKEEAIKILMGGEIVTLNCDIKYYTEAIKMAIEALDRASAPEYEYRMVRSFAPSSSQSGDMLDRYLKAGYEFVRASEFIPSPSDKVGYIEYILRRKRKDRNG